MSLLRLSVVVAVLAVSCGCQSRVRVKVDRLTYPGQAQDSRLQQDSIMGQRVAEAIVQLKTVRDAHLAAEKEIGKLAQDLSSRHKNEQIHDYFRPVLEVLSEGASELQGKIDQLYALFAVEDAIGSSPQIMVELLSSGQAIAARRQSLLELAEALNSGDMPPILRTPPAGPVLDRVLQRARQATVEQERQALLTLTSGFGGFQTIGVAQINPADSAYDSVLNNDIPRGRLEPFSLVEATVSGTSGVMIVQESPSQFRIYQISNDPTQLLQNAAFLISKALQAGARFMLAIGVP